MDLIMADEHPVLFEFSALSWLMILQIVGVCQAMNNILDSMAKKGMAVPVWSGAPTKNQET